MGSMVKIKSGRYQWWCDGRNIFVKIDDGLDQKFIIQTKDFKAIDQYGFAFLIDQIYRKKVRDTDSFLKSISKYRLVSTSRHLE